jgi:enoyl-CoA hydratase/carnithine racemase
VITPKSFLYEVSAEGIATITLNRPERLNALTFETYAELRDTFAALQDEKDVRVVIVTGKGKGFCSGGDVRDIIGELFNRDQAGLLEFTRMTGTLLLNMRRLRKPIIARINGVVAGAGAMIALGADFRIAETGSKFAFLFTKVGLSGADMGACLLLPRIVGMTKATELLLTGDSIGAEEAHRIGLVNKVCPPDFLVEETLALARRLAKGPGHGIAVTKECLNAEVSLTLEQAIEAEAKAQAECMTHPDFREAFLAFMEKRPPRFRSE